MVREHRPKSRPGDTDSAGKKRAFRFPRVFAVHFFGEKVETGKAQDPDDFGHDCGGCDVVLPRYIHLPFSILVDTEPWTGENDQFPPLFTPNDVRCVPP